MYDDKMIVYSNIVVAQQHGFYETIAGELIQSLMDMNGEDSITYEYAKKMFSDKYNENFKVFLEEAVDELELEDEPALDLEIVGVWSPQFYNFETDEFKVDVGNVKTLAKIVQAEYFEELLKAIKTTTTSRDGFIATYTQESYLGTTVENVKSNEYFVLADIVDGWGQVEVGLLVSVLVNAFDLSESLESEYIQQLTTSDF